MEETRQNHKTYLQREPWKSTRYSTEKVCTQAARELTGAHNSHKAQAKQQGLTFLVGFFFFLQGRRSDDEEGCHRNQKKSQHLLKP